MPPGRPRRPFALAQGTIPGGRASYPLASTSPARRCVFLCLLSCGPMAGRARSDKERNPEPDQRQSTAPASSIVRRALLVVDVRTPHQLAHSPGGSRRQLPRCGRHPRHAGRCPSIPHDRVAGQCRHEHGQEHCPDCRPHRWPLALLVSLAAHAVSLAAHGAALLVSLAHARRVRDRPDRHANNVETARYPQRIAQRPPLMVRGGRCSLSTSVRRSPGPARHREQCQSSLVSLIRGHGEVWCVDVDECALVRARLWGVDGEQFHPDRPVRAFSQRTA
jgi:hypothetical protein